MFVFLILFISTVAAVGAPPPPPSQFCVVCEAFTTQLSREARAWHNAYTPSVVIAERARSVVRATYAYERSAATLMRLPQPLLTTADPVVVTGLGKLPADSVAKAVRVLRGPWVPFTQIFRILCGDNETCPLF